MHLFFHYRDQEGKINQENEEEYAKAQQKTIDQIYGDITELLKNILGNKSVEKLIQEFEKEYVKKSKFTNQHLRILKDVVKSKKEFKKGKSESHKIDMVRKDADILIKDLTEFVQRKELIALNKGKMVLKTKDKKIEIINADGKTFIFEGNLIKKVEEKVEESSLEELEKALLKQKEKDEVEIDPKIFEVLKKEYGKFDVLF